MPRNGHPSEDSGGAAPDKREETATGRRPWWGKLVDKSRGIPPPRFGPKKGTGTSATGTVGNANHHRHIRRRRSQSPFDAAFSLLRGCKPPATFSHFSKPSKPGTTYLVRVFRSLSGCQAAILSARRATTLGCSAARFAFSQGSFDRSNSCGRRSVRGWVRA